MLAAELARVAPTAVRLVRVRVSGVSGSALAGRDSGGQAFGIRGRA